MSPGTLDSCDDSSIGTTSSQDTMKDDIGEEKAVRPDNVEAEAEDWDWWMVDNFVCSKSRPVVCIGKYNAANHGRLFNVMKQLLIHRYRRNLSQIHGQGTLSWSLSKMQSRMSLLQSRKWSTIFKKSANQELSLDQEVGVHAISRAANSSWWD